MLALEGSVLGVEGSVVALQLSVLGVEGVQVGVGGIGGVDLALEMAMELLAASSWDCKSLLAEFRVATWAVKEELALYKVL